ncbi:related to transcription factor Ask10p [Cephalotrichum gorgonifer]|uniref:Related to transcription factor Ask10p n=1 Tax=Cephalotrichum gorgonifer TaxID=2041049 RepID=A0AAE8SXL2_9PEZI|nr:related to transcription factor Ask10p [Cephalotrichum gorgonifer]
MATSPTSQLPSRTATNFSAFSDDAVPDFDPSTTAGLLAERLQAWKHAVVYLEEYVEAVEKIHKVQAKEYEKALKTISQPLKEGHHFDQSLGGVAGFFEHLRQNTQAIVNSNVETEKALKSSVLTVLERLHKEIKHKAKELSSGVEKGAKEVEKARNTTQQSIELLGQQTAAYESAGGKVQAHNDPYVVKRGVLYRLGKQVLEENSHRNELIAVQKNFLDFECHVVQVIQQAVETFTQLVGGQADKVRSLYVDALGAAQRVPPEFEWIQFASRCGDQLVNPNEPPRSVEAIEFANMHHASTKPLVEGGLERKSRNKLSWGYASGYYVVTPAGFLHEFKDQEDARHEPKPELSVYLPGCMVGAANGEKFSVKGKDTSKTISSKLAGSSEFSFKANSSVDAAKWYKIIHDIANSVPGAASPVSPTAPLSPASPVSPSPASPTAAGDAAAAPAPAAPAPAAAAAVGTSGDDEKLVLNEAVTPTEEHAAQETGVTTGASKDAGAVGGGEKAAAAAAPPA